MRSVASLLDIARGSLETVKSSSSELSLQFPLKQLHLFFPHFPFESPFSSMKFITILSRQIVPTSASPALASFSDELLRRTPGNCLSKSRFNLDFGAGLIWTWSVTLLVVKFVSIGWTFIGNGIIDVARENFWPSISNLENGRKEKASSLRKVRRSN